MTWRVDGICLTVSCRWRRDDVRVHDGRLD